MTLMKLVAFGANGATGRLLTQQAIEAGHEVRAVTRHPDAFPLSHERLRVVRGDALDLASVKDAVAGQDAVISTLGVPNTRRPITLYSRGMANIIEAMHDQGVRRVIAVTSSALESPGTNGFLLEKILQPIIANTLGRTTYQDMRKMEALLRDSDLDWTVVRSNGLFAGDGVTPYEVAEGYITGKFTAREDLADLLLKEAERGGTSARRSRSPPARAPRASSSSCSPRPTRTSDLSAGGPVRDACLAAGDTDPSAGPTRQPPA
jgi:putative NADH-flavin reductase